MSEKFCTTDLSGDCYLKTLQILGSGFMVLNILLKPWQSSWVQVIYVPEPRYVLCDWPGVGVGLVQADLRDTAGSVPDTAGKRISQ